MSEKQGAKERYGLKGDRNQCTGCGALFNSVGAFDMHRTGPFSARQCLSADEMTAKGMAVNKHGFWTKTVMSDAERVRIENARQASPVMLEAARDGG